MFEKALLGELGASITGTGWKKSKCALFRHKGRFYHDVFISVHRNAYRTQASFRIKPIALDPILWDILSIPENHNQPLSFRTWGAFTCSPLPLSEIELERQGDSPGAVAAALSSWLRSPACDSGAEDAVFSELVAAHPNQVERGAYAVTLITSLIAEGKVERAAALLARYQSGAEKSSHNFTSYGVSFHELAHEWIHNRSSHAEA